MYPITIRKMEEIDVPNSILVIAAALKKLYEQIYPNKKDLTEMKMHKLLYFAQKIHYYHFGEWLFNEDFEGWIHGPVNRKVRSNFNYLSEYEQDLTLEEEFTLREVIFEYGQYSAGTLRRMSHEDSAYKKSREGLSDDEPGDEIVEKEDMIKDLINEFVSNEKHEGFLDCEVH